MPHYIPLTQAYHPATFLDRGVSVPFTTPLLAGTRARPSDRSGLELVVPNPSGGRGVYILPWTAVGELCRPTLHDRMLTERITALRRVSPSALRQVAREVALEGLAGRQASLAAGQASREDADAAMVANFHLLLDLVQQSELPGENEVPPQREHPAELERRAKRATARVAPRLGMTPDAIAASLEEMASVFSHVGVGPRAAQARLPRLLAQLCAVQAELVAWGAANLDESGSWAGLAATAAELTVEFTRPLLAEAQALAGNVSDLLRAWREDAAAVTRRAVRPDWLLDGWETICLVWQHAATPVARRAALGEIALLIPVIPAEIGDWLGGQVNAEGSQRFRRTVELNEDWRTGVTVFDLVARNEHFRALAA